MKTKRKHQPRCKSLLDYKRVLWIMNPGSLHAFDISKKLSKKGLFIDSKDYQKYLSRTRRIA